MNKLFNFLLTLALLTVALTSFFTVERLHTPTQADPGQIVFHTPVGKYTADYRELTITLLGENDVWHFCSAEAMTAWIESTTEGDLPSLSADDIGNLYLVDDRDYPGDSFELFDDYRLIGRYELVDEKRPGIYVFNPETLTP